MGPLKSMLRKDKTDTSSISFTAHYTGYVWYHNGLSAEPFRTHEGALYYSLLWPLETVGRKLVGTNIRDSLLQRHFLIDHLISRAIEEQNVTQVLEIACGLSPRGWRFAAKYPQLKYVEADLPDMARRKQRLLRSIDGIDERHKVITCNILADGPDSLEQVLAREFDRSKPLLVITEGLVNYFDLETISVFWRRLQGDLAKFPLGLYLTDNYSPGSHPGLRRMMNTLAGMLGAASRSNANFHFRDDAGMENHFRALGFAGATAHNPSDYYATLDIPRSGKHAFVRILEARA